MGINAGLWLDHRQAVVVVISDKGIDTQRILSGVEKQLRRSGDSPLKGPFEAQSVPADDNQEAILTGALNIYYDEVIVWISQAEALLLFGPAEAKDELKKRLEHSGLGTLIVGVETADKMTDRQIEAKVKQYFQGRSGHHCRTTDG